MSHACSARVATDCQVAREAELLWSGSTQPLPYEQPHEVGQNVASASSIRATQHTQVTRGSAAAWPVFNLQAKPQWVPALQAFLDVCQISTTEPDAFVVKLRTSHPSHPPLLQLLQDIRLGLLREFGGRAVDFDFHVIADVTPGWFVMSLRAGRDDGEGAGAGLQAEPQHAVDQL
eukprot:SAG22_NODE_940_length_6402_cov_34.673172_6_plen_175_part_00